MIYTNSDGGARGNPGPGACGVIVRRDADIQIRASKYLGQRVTNNVAEYEGLILALEKASQIKDCKEVTCILDSELIIKQLMGEYKVRNPTLMKLFLRVQKLQDKFEKIRYKHVSRWDKFQQMADEILNEELDKVVGPRKYVPKK